MRSDAVGMFWEEVDYKTDKKQTLLIEEGWTEVISGFWAEQYLLDNGADVREVSSTLDNAYLTARASKTGAKRTPPEPVWLHPDYLPGLDEARAFNVPLFSEEELLQAAVEVFTKGVRHKLIFDIECYGNYFLIAFISLDLGKVVYLELSDDSELDCGKLKWIFENFCVIGFNSNNYDIWIASMAVHGCSTAAMKSVTAGIIEYGEKGWHLLRRHKVKKLKTDHIDLIEVAPLFASLKIYGGRMHTKQMQDLPFPPGTVLSEPQRAIIKWYCVKDLRVTLELYRKVIKEIVLREEMGHQYGVDLRSKSDAQIAEVVIGQEVEKLNGYRPFKPEIEPGTCYYYQVPEFINFQTPLMNNLVNIIKKTPFVVSEFGNVGLPQELKSQVIRINQTDYKLGIGGLHSVDKNMSHYADKNTILKDVDATSYYPFIILLLGLYPKHLGPNFLTVFRTLVERRVRAKVAKNKTAADTIKIVVNGSFGKLGSVFSILYAPDLLIQVTITGQLSLLLLIESLELANIPVVSANTDGIVIKCPKHLESTMDVIIKQWEINTGFSTEESLYAALFSRDVNNYLAIKDPSCWKEGDTTDDKVKTKGIFAKPGLSKNPQNEICIVAIKELLINGIAIEETIRNCKDITKFVNVRTVKGGAVKLHNNEGTNGLFLGKAIRWYYAKNIAGEIVYATTGNKVPKTEGAQPLMDLPGTFPQDVDYNWYEKESFKILKQISYSN